MSGTVAFALTLLPAAAMGTKLPLGACSLASSIGAFGVALRRPTRRSWCLCTRAAGP